MVLPTLFVLFAVFGWMFLLQGLVTATISKSASGLPITFPNASFEVSGENAVIANPTVLAAQPGVLTTRSTDSTGSLTMTNAGHGIVTGQRVDLYWTGGKCYKAVVGTVSGTTVPIASVAGGDVLPAAASSISVGICNQVAFNVVGDDMEVLAFGAAANGYLVLETAGSAVELAQYQAANTGYLWTSSDGTTNPLATDTITKAFFSHDNTAASVTASGACAITNP